MPYLTPTQRWWRRHRWQVWLLLATALLTILLTLSVDPAERAFRRWLADQMSVTEESKESR